MTGDTTNRVIDPAIGI